MVMLWLMRLSARARDENIVKATNSEIKSTNINIKGKRRTYYISDILGKKTRWRARRSNIKIG